MDLANVNPDFLRQVSLYSQKVIDNTEIRHANSFDVPYGLRIDAPPVPAMLVPRMPSSAASTEDKTVPRVITASTLVGCMNGATYVLSRAQDNKKTPDSVRNYYHITACMFDYCLLPNNYLVFDAEDTQEQWLISYNKHTRAYRPEWIGEMFVSEVQEKMDPNRTHNPTTVTLYAFVKKGFKVPVSLGKVMDEGYHKLIFDFSYYSILEERGRMNYAKDNTYIHSTISGEEYKSFRTLCVKKGY